MRAKVLTVLSFLFLFLLMGKIYYDTNSIEIRHFTLCNFSFGPQSSSFPPYTSRLAPYASLVDVLQGLKIAHLSDLHIGGLGLREEKVLEILAHEKPDLIFITGDLVSFKAPYEPAMSFLERISAPLGVYAVLGNTEYTNENGSCILCHEKGSRKVKGKGGVVFLRNSLVSLEIKGKKLKIIGVDYPTSKKSNLKTGRPETRLGQPSILLAHSPEIFEEASNSGIDFVLSGHTHGGQLIGVKYLRKMFPIIDPALEFLEGFFQKGTTLMYVSRGLGTSFLPFRLGVKPEVTFFGFGDGRGNSNTPGQFAISNNTPTTIFAGLSVGTLVETFNIFTYLKPSIDKPDPGSSSVLFDFESEEDLKKLNWECHIWFERSEAHVTSGNYSLRCVLPPGMYPGIAFEGIRENWSGYQFLKMDVFNPGEKTRFHVRIDDSESGVDYGKRFDLDLWLEPGPNPISIPTGSFRTNLHQRLLNICRIRKLLVFLPDNPRTKELYIDHLRLE